MSNLLPEIVIDLPFLAGEINDAHKQVQFHGRSMLYEAKRAGEALLQAKGRIPHGGFKVWIGENCRCSYSQASKYMRVVKSVAGDTFDDDRLDATIEGFLGYEKKPAPEPTSPTLDQTAAERVLKIAALAERGTDGEKEAAKRQLDRLAAEYGKGADDMVADAMVVLPDSHLTAEEAERAENIRELARLRAQVAQMQAAAAKKAAEEAAAEAEYNRLHAEHLERVQRDFEAEPREVLIETIATMAAILEQKGVYWEYDD